MSAGDKAALAGGARKMGQTDMVVSRLGYGAMELAGAPLATHDPPADRPPP